jgi:Tol biopolymer transport system component
MPALSPDGRHVAFGAREGAGPTRIWVYDLAAPTPHPLAGTEGGYRPFWSPDGRTLGFFTWGHLNTIPAEVGTVTQLGPSRDGRGGSWNRTGTIIYAPYASGPILSVPAGGGSTTEVTGTAERVGSGTHRFPQFLPDGEHFLYLDRPAPFGAAPHTAIVVGRLGSAERHVVLEIASNAVYAQRHLLYVRDGALVAQPFDPETFELSGVPRPLVTDLLVNRRFSYGVFSASEAGIAVFMTGKQSDLSQLVWRDEGGARLGELGNPGMLTGYGGLAVSADGHWAAVSRVDAGAGDADLWLYDLVRGAETRLARAGTDESDPEFSPDGKTLYFSIVNDASEASTIVARSLATGEERVVTKGDGVHNIAPQSASPDGRFLLYDERALSTAARVMLVRLDGGGEPRALLSSDADDGLAQVSPDGRWVVWESDRSGRYEIYAAPFPGGGSPVQVTRDGGTQPRWHPSGRELFFKAPDNTLTEAPVETASGTFAVGTPRRLFQVPEFFGWTYAVSADGRRFLVREPLAERDASPITLLTDWTSLVTPQ